MIRSRRPIRRGGPIRRRVRLGARRRRAKAAGHIDPDSWEFVVLWYGGCCAYCQDPATQQDHVVSLARGGAHSIDNVVPACARCNYRKGVETWEPRRRHPLMGDIGPGRE